MLQIFQSLAPVVLTIALGAALMHWRFFNEAFRVGLERFAYWIGLPCLLVIELSGVRLDAAAQGSIKLTLLLTLLCFVCMLIAAMVGRAMRIQGGSLGTFVQASLRSNIAFVGLPIVIYAAAANPNLDKKAVSELAVLALGPIVLLFNVVCVLLLLIPQHSLDAKSLPKIFKPLATNPLIIACVIGLLLAVFEVKLPFAIHRTIESLGKTAPPLSLVSLGASLVSLPIRGELVRATASSVIKTILSPLLTYFACRGLQLSPEQTLVAMVYSACPTAVASYVMASQLKGDAPLAASAVVISTLMSLFALAAVLYFA